MRHAAKKIMPDVHFWNRYPGYLSGDSRRWLKSERGDFAVLTVLGAVFWQRLRGFVAQQKPAP